MKIFFAILALCLPVVLGQTLAELLASIPLCAESCLLPVIVQSQCNITTPSTLAACLCPDVSAQQKISACTQAHCNYTQQVAVVKVSSQLCAGYPIPSRSKEMIDTAIVLLPIVIVFVTLRLCSRFLIVKDLWWDDWIIIVASILAIAIFSLEIKMSNQGFGKHIWNIEPQNLPSIELLFYISQLFYVIVQVLTKISILMLYLRIFPQRLIRQTVAVIITLIALHGTVFLFIVAFQCSPVYSIWDRTITGKCLDKNTIVFVGAGSSILEDFLVLILPIPCVKSLNIKTGKRISLVIMFSIGSFACITSMIRLKHIIGFGDYSDATWNNVDVFNWSCIEIATAVVCACLPAVRVLLSRLFPTIFGSLQTHNMKPSNSGQVRSFDRKGLSRIEDTEIANDAISEGSQGAESSVSVAKTESSWRDNSDETELVEIPK